MIGWLALLVASAALFVIVAVAAWWQHRRDVPGRSRRRAERAAWAQHATALAGRAQQAAVRAAAARAAIEAAEQARAVAWAELEEIEAAHDEAARRHAEAVRRSAERPPSQPKEVTHAALAAYRRGDLTKEQLWRVWQWGSGWDPEVDRCERELYRLRAARRAAQQRYQAAASQERDVLATSDVAEVQARALAEEVATASSEAGWDDGLRAELS